MNDAIRKRIGSASVLASLLFLMASRSALAQSTEGESNSTPVDHSGLEVGAFGGVYLYSKYNEIGRYIDDNNAPENAFTFGLRLGYALNNTFSIESEGGLAFSEARTAKTNIKLATYRIQALAHVLELGMARPFVVLGFQGMSSFDAENAKILYRDTDAGPYVGVGSKFELGSNFGLRIDARYNVMSGVRGHNYASDLEFLGGLYYRFGASAEPQPEPAPPAPEPEPVAPVPTPEPVVVQESDSDGDGIVDSQDKCPNEAEDKDGFQDADGCIDDNDGDGVADGDDECPAEAGVPALGGCPDSDNDGIANIKDKCPQEPETRNGFEDDDGCPDIIPEAVKKFTGRIEGIKFKTGSDLILKESFPLLNRAADVLIAYLSVRMEISGHTDDKGKREMNVDLSRRRAESVRTYFIGKGIAADRLTAVGHGPDKPLVENKTEKGRSENRRVEFQILQTP
jgi:OmpA-OmpF porin, OOP family